MSLRKEMLMKNIEYVGYHDLGGKMGFQIAMQKAKGRYYLYTASFRDNGWNILDVTDPANPRHIKWVEGPWISDARDGQGTLKLQIADGYMITAHSGLIKFLMGCEDDLPCWGGIKIWDVKTDPEDPKFLGEYECLAPGGVHRFFYNGGRYAYLSACYEGYDSFILKIVDIQDPTNPVGVGEYYVPSQKMEGVDKTAFGDHLSKPFLHAVTVRDDIAFLAYANEGVTLLDVKDKSNPKFLGNLPMQPTLGGGMGGAPVHTAYPIGDRPFAVVTNEGERSMIYHGGDTGRGKKIITQPICIAGIIELADPTHPNLISVFPYPEMPEGYTHGTNFNFVDGVRVPLGPHNFFDAFGTDVYKAFNDKALCCYFWAGLRIYDVSDPFVPKEIAYFLPPDPENLLFDNADGTLMLGARASNTEDVVVDDRGFIYLTTLQDGLYIVRYNGGL